jgi:hypothetical protein
LPRPEDVIQPDIGGVAAVGVLDNKPKWTNHVKSVYAKLQGDDPETTFKQAMSHARATFK